MRATWGILEQGFRLRSLPSLPTPTRTSSCCTAMARSFQRQRVLDGRPARDAHIRSPYSAYIDLMMGRLDAIRAITKGVLKLKGPMTKILRYVKSTNLWVDILRSIPTEFEGAFADWSFGD